LNLEESEDYQQSRYFLVHIRSALNWIRTELITPRFSFLQMHLYQRSIRSHALCPPPLIQKVFLLIDTGSWRFDWAGLAPSNQPRLTLNLKETKMHFRGMPNTWNACDK
jgi:hypothetical protein